MKVSGQKFSCEPYMYTVSKFKICAEKLIEFRQIIRRIKENPYIGLVKDT